MSLLSHVADIEQPDTGSNRVVLGLQAGKLDRHIPAGKRYESAASRNVRIIERRASKHRGPR